MVVINKAIKMVIRVVVKEPIMGVIKEGTKAIQQMAMREAIKVEIVLAIMMDIMEIIIKAEYFNFELVPMWMAVMVQKGVFMVVFMEEQVNLMWYLELVNKQVAKKVNIKLAMLKAMMRERYRVINSMKNFNSHFMFSSEILNFLLKLLVINYLQVVIAKSMMLLVIIIDLVVYFNQVISIMVVMLIKLVMVTIRLIIK